MGMFIVEQYDKSAFPDIEDRDRVFEKLKTDISKAIEDMETNDIIGFIRVPETWYNILSGAQKHYLNKLCEIHKLPLRVDRVVIKTN